MVDAIKWKKNDIRKERMLRKRRELRKADPQKIAAIRQKFVEQAKKYYGYPYAKKYWPPDSPEYKSKLFLDCCGLVRRVMRDLEDDFGFILGPWNQAYMYDTLPITVQSEREMKPGDLVFISATYYNPKSKKQRHNMTHVEIWAGEGKKTIGARWNNGKVQLWDSYKFTAKSYHSETYHFKSLDTWLKGICKSFCPDHKWKRKRYNPKKKSIFAVPEQIQGDEAAGDDDDNLDNFLVRGNTFCQDGNRKAVPKQPPRPKTEMDTPNMPHSASSDSLDQQRPAVRPIKNDKKKGQTRRAKTSLPKIDKGLTFSDGFKLEISGTGQGRRNENNGKVGKVEVQRSLNGNLTVMGRKGLYLGDLVGAQHDTSNGKVEGDLDNEEDDDEDDDDIDGSDDSDDEYMDDENSGSEEVDNTENKESENGHENDAEEKSPKNDDLLEISTEDKKESEDKQKQLLSQNGSSTGENTSTENCFNKTEQNVSEFVDPSSDIENNNNEKIKTADEELNTNQSANIENSTKDAYDDKESTAKDTNKTLQPQGSEVGGEGYSESGTGIAMESQECPSKTSIRSGELGDSESSSKGATVQ